MNQIIETAMTYLNNNDQLIYSYRGNTFLQDGELYDTEHGGRGRIDCSTLVHLALLGIPYEESPYATGDIKRFFSAACPWYDIENQPSGEVFRLNSDRAGDIRRAYGLAKFCRERGLEIQTGSLQPGDLVFFRAPESVRAEYVKYGAYLAISHVGLVTEDTSLMINATGRSDQEYNAHHDPVRLMQISEKGRPLMAARIIR